MSKYWVSILSESTYSVYKNRPEVTVNTQYTLDHLRRIESPTACYVDSSLGPLKIGDKTYYPFYRDQQDCVIWYGEDMDLSGKIYAEIEPGVMVVVSDSLAEFVTRMEIEAKIFCKLGIDLLNLFTPRWLPRSCQSLPEDNLLTSEEHAYLSFFYNLAYR